MVLILLKCQVNICAVDAGGAVGSAVAGGDVGLDGTELANPERVGVGRLSDVRPGGGVLEKLLGLQETTNRSKESSKAIGLETSTWQYTRLDIVRAEAFKRCPAVTSQTDADKPD